MEFTDQNFKEEVEQSDLLVLIDFFAQWCGPCKLIGPIIHELAEEYKEKKVKIGQLDIDKSKKIAESYDIMSIPTIILFKNGKEIKRVTGLQSKDFLKELINKNL